MLRAHKVVAAYPKDVNTALHPTTFLVQCYYSLPTLHTSCDTLAFGRYLASLLSASFPRHVLELLFLYHPAGHLGQFAPCRARGALRLTSSSRRNHVRGRSRSRGPLAPATRTFLRSSLPQSLLRVYPAFHPTLRTSAAVATPAPATPTPPQATRGNTSPRRPALCSSSRKHPAAKCSQHHAAGAGWSCTRITSTCTTPER